MVVKIGFVVFGTWYLTMMEVHGAMGLDVVGLVVGCGDTLG